MAFSQPELQLNKMQQKNYFGGKKPRHIMSSLLQIIDFFFFLNLSKNWFLKHNLSMVSDLNI